MKSVIALSLLVILVGCDKTKTQAAKSPVDDIGKISKVANKTIPATVSPEGKVVLGKLVALLAKADIGMNRNDYVKVLGDAWGEAKPYLESAQAENDGEFANQIRKAFLCLRYAVKYWERYIEFKIKSELIRGSDIELAIKADDVANTCRRLVVLNWGLSGLYSENATDLSQGKPMRNKDDDKNPPGTDDF